MPRGREEKSEKNQIDSGHTTLFFYTKKEFFENPWGPPLKQQTGVKCFIPYIQQPKSFTLGVEFLTASP